MKRIYITPRMSRQFRAKRAKLLRNANNGAVSGTIPKSVVPKHTTKVTEALKGVSTAASIVSVSNMIAKDISSGDADKTIRDVAKYAERKAVAKVSKVTREYIKKRIAKRRTNKQNNPATKNATSQTIGTKETSTNHIKTESDISTKYSRTDIQKTGVARNNQAASARISKDSNKPSQNHVPEETIKPVTGAKEQKTNIQKTGVVQNSNNTNQNGNKSSTILNQDTSAKKPTGVTSNKTQRTNIQKTGAIQNGSSTPNSTKTVVGKKTRATASVAKKENPTKLAQGTARKNAKKKYVAKQLSKGKLKMPGYKTTKTVTGKTLFRKTGQAAAKKATTSTAVKAGSKGIASLGWVGLIIVAAILVTILILAIAFAFFGILAASPAGMFSKSQTTLRTKITEINQNYYQRIEESIDLESVLDVDIDTYEMDVAQIVCGILNTTSFGWVESDLEISGMTIPWKEIITVFAAEHYYDENFNTNSLDVWDEFSLETTFNSYMSYSLNKQKTTQSVKDGFEESVESVIKDLQDEGFLQLLEDVWYVVSDQEEEMNIDIRMFITIYFDVYSTTPMQYAIDHDFDEEQIKYMERLLSESYDTQWKEILFGIRNLSSDSMCDTALSYYGRTGEEFKAWYGSDTAWCDIFVSYCGYMSGYNSGKIADNDSADCVVPIYATVINTWNWYKARGNAVQVSHMGGSGALPEYVDLYPGCLIFYDYDKKYDPNATWLSHIGIVTEYDADTGLITVISGNSYDKSGYSGAYYVAIKQQYPTDPGIYGYAFPEYNHK